MFGTIHNLVRILGVYHEAIATPVTVAKQGAPIRSYDAPPQLENREICVNYQSRVFTFVNSRANRLKDACAKGLRHIKVAVVWSGQVLFYPIQLLLSATKLLQPQLPPPRQQATLPPPTAEIDIEQALVLVENVAGYPIELSRSTVDLATNSTDLTQPQDSAATTSAQGEIVIRERIKLAASNRSEGSVATTKPIVRGLSSLLSDRRLVLVTTTNELLDVLTIAQQQDIRRRIGFDLAISWQAWHSQRLIAEDSTSDFSSNQLSGDLDRLNLPSSDRATSPQRNLFNRLGSWFNRSPDRVSAAALPSQFLPSSQYAANWQSPLGSELNLPQLPPIGAPSERANFTQSLTIQPSNWFQQLWRYYRDYLYIAAPTERAIVPQQPQPFELTPLEPQAVAPSPAELDTSRSTKAATKVKYQPTDVARKNRQHITHQPDWIEAVAEEIGYSRSPFATFLAWLDRLMLAIENWAIALWQKITSMRPLS